MKTDSVIHRFFREFRGAFFTLMGEDERQAERYEFTAIEMKERAFRFGGIFKPQVEKDQLFFLKRNSGGRRFLFAFLRRDRGLSAPEPDAASLAGNRSFSHKGLRSRFASALLGVL